MSAWPTVSVSSPTASRKATGAHYTPPKLAEFVAKEIVASYEGSSESVRILDPAVGDGSLLSALLPHAPAAYAFGYDTDETAVLNATQRLQNQFPRAKCEISRQDFTALCAADRDGDFFSDQTVRDFDIVIANPPYVRTQVMGATKARNLAESFGLTGRVDLYFSFLVCISRVLRPGGIAGVIVSNRFMTTRSGSEVRKRLLEEFDVLHVWDLGDTKLFEAAVLPAVLILRKKGLPIKSESRFTSIYSSSEEAESNAESVLDAVSKAGNIRVRDEVFSVRHGFLDHNSADTGVWRLATEAADAWLATVQRHTFCTFGDVGKVRVGVKTTADNVFIRSDWDEMPFEERPELLRPLLTHHNARRFKADYSAKRTQILYPHETVNGKRRVVNIEQYPRTAAHLAIHRTQLEKRTYVTEAGRKWYEIWVPQNPDHWNLPKLVFTDISQEPTFWMDLEGCVVNGDCYWLALTDESKMDLLWLALAVGNSRFIEEYYDHVFHNKLYAGRRRFMTQYVERFPLPNPASEESQKIIALAKRIHSPTGENNIADSEATLQSLVRRVFGLQSEEIAG